MADPADISVVMPVHNGATVLERALRSVLIQTVPPARIVVVDDGSTDGTAGVARSFGDRVLLVHQPNTGASSARNRGVAECGTDLVAFLDADDEWMPGFLEAIRRLATRHPECGLYCTAYTRLFADGSEIPCVVRGLPDPVPGWEGVLPDYFKVAATSDPPAWTSAVAVRRGMFLDTGGFPQGVTSGEDLLTWARLAARAPVAFSSLPMARFRQPADALPGKVPRATRTPQTPDRVGQGLRDLLPAVPPSQRHQIKAYIAHWHKMRASCYFRLGRPVRTLGEMCKAVTAAPFSAALYLGVWRSMMRGLRP
jgi:hypothetical protein